MTLCNSLILSPLPLTSSFPLIHTHATTLTHSIQGSGCRFAHIEPPRSTPPALLPHLDTSNATHLTLPSATPPFRGHIPGFYYDEVKKKYFKIPQSGAPWPAMHSPTEHVAERVQRRMMPNIASWFRARERGECFLEIRDRRDSEEYGTKVLQSCGKGVSSGPQVIGEGHASPTPSCPHDRMKLKRKHGKSAFTAAPMSSNDSSASVALPESSISSSLLPSSSRKKTSIAASAAVAQSQPRTPSTILASTPDFCNSRRLLDISSIPPGIFMRSQQTLPMPLHGVSNLRVVARACSLPISSNSSDTFDSIWSPSATQSSYSATHTTTQYLDVEKTVYIYCLLNLNTIGILHARPSLGPSRVVVTEAYYPLRRMNVLQPHPTLPFRLLAAFEGGAESAWIGVVDVCHGGYCPSLVTQQRLRDCTIWTAEVRKRRTLVFSASTSSLHCQYRLLF